MSTDSKRKPFGMLGVIAGFLALFTVLVGPSLHQAMYPPQPIEDVVAETAVKLRDRVKARLKGDPAPKATSTFQLSSQELPYTLALALAAAAITGGCISYLRREDHRYAYVACG